MAVRGIDEDKDLVSGTINPRSLDRDGVRLSNLFDESIERTRQRGTIFLAAESATLRIVS